MQETLETRVRSLGQEVPLEEGMATHSSILPCRIPWTEEPDGLESKGSQGVRHDRSDLAVRYVCSILCVFTYLALKSLLNLPQYCFCFMFWFFWPRGLWHLSSLTRDWTHTPCIWRWSLNHWTTREVPSSVLLNFLVLLSRAEHRAWHKVSILPQ